MKQRVGTRIRRIKQRPKGPAAERSEEKYFKQHLLHYLSIFRALRLSEILLHWLAGKFKFFFAYFSFVHKSQRISSRKLHFK